MYSILDFPVEPGNGFYIYENVIRNVLDQTSRSKIFHLHIKLKLATSADRAVALWFSGYQYCTTSFNKAGTQVLRTFKSCSRRVGDLRW